MSARQKIIFLWRSVPPVRPQPLLAGVYEGSFMHGWKRFLQRWARDGGRVGDVESSSGAPQTIAVVEAKVDDAGAPWVIAAAEVGRWC
jgi:hypothetical protein